MIDLLGQRGLPRWPVQAIEFIRSLLTWFHQARIGPWRAAAALLCAVACVGIVLEMRSSLIESLVFSRLTREMTFHVAAGSSPQFGFPSNGPYDLRLGYAQLPDFIRRLSSRDFTVRRQVRLSPRLERLIRSLGYAIFREKAQAGLTIRDRSGAPLYASRFPERSYRRFDEIPGLVVQTLLFVEDRHLLDSDYPRRNPAIDWKRFSRALLGRIAGLVSPHLRQGGASTLATQIEKFRHSPKGVTQDSREKLRQMFMASLRAYQGALTQERHAGRLS